MADVGVRIGEREAASGGMVNMKMMLWAMVSVLSVVGGVRGQTLVTVEGTRIEKQIESISASGEILLSGADRAVQLQDLRLIKRKMEKTSGGLFAQRVYLADGSVLIVHHLTMSEGAMVFDWIGGEGARMPVDQVRGILLVPLSAKGNGKAEPEGPFVKATADRDAKQDVLLAIRDEGLTAVPGALQAMDDKQATFVWNDQARQIDRGKVYGVAMAAMNKPVDLTGWVCAELSDGSTVWGKLEGLKDGKLTLDRPEGVMTLPWEQVAELRVNSARMVFMSAMAESGQETGATVTYAWGMRKDASVMGEPIRVGGVMFEHGLGVHAPSAVTYDIGGKYAKFAATIGLDDRAPAEGDCVFVVKADGKEVMRQRMKAGEAGKVVVVDVAGVKRLELAVEKGENLDVGDLADWADARLIR